MGFWIFMSVQNLLIPALMLGFGWKLWKRTPKEVNGIFGYRTPMSGKNKDTWMFANQYFGRLWYRLGCILMPLSVLAMLPVLGRDMDTVALAGTGVTIALSFLLLLPILPTERALRKKFRRDGSARMENGDENTR